MILLTILLCSANVTLEVDEREMSHRFITANSKLEFYAKSELNNFFCKMCLSLSFK